MKLPEAKRVAELILATTFSINYNESQDRDRALIAAGKAVTDFWLSVRIDENTPKFAQGPVVSESASQDWIHQVINDLDDMTKPQLLFTMSNLKHKTLGKIKLLLD